MDAPYFAVLATPVGRVRIEGDDRLVHRIRIGVDDAPRQATATATRKAEAQLAAYFRGELTAFDLPLAPSATLRGQVLRDAMIAVGYGDTASYGELARRCTSSARAVGQACARNPFPLVVPCHRILAAGGKLGPYSAGDGPVTKRWLLDFEASQPNSRPTPTVGSTTPS